MSQPGTSAAWYGQDGRTSRAEPEKKEAVTRNAPMANDSWPRRIVHGRVRQHTEDILRDFARTLDPEAAEVIGFGYLLPLAALALTIRLVTAAVRRRRATS